MLRTLLRYVSRDSRRTAVLAVALVKILAGKGIVTPHEVMCCFVETETELPWRGGRWFRWRHTFRRERPLHRGC